MRATWLGIGLLLLAQAFEDSIQVLIVQPLVSILGVVAMACFKLLQETDHAYNAQFAR